MQSVRHQRSLVILIIISFVMTSVSGYYWYRFNDGKLRAKFADDQTTIFSMMRAKALKNNTAEASACLGYVISYYPSGTKQSPGSTLDQIVERSRAIAIEDMVKHLRNTSSEDLGDDPDAWIHAHVSPNQ